MFPTPATRRWSSRNAFTGALRPRAARAQHVGREARVERLRAEPLVEVVVELRRGPSITTPVPNRRWSTNSRRWPSSSTSRTRRCGRAGGVVARAATQSRLPVMRRCMTRKRSPSSSSDQVLAAPAAARSIRRPRSARSTSSGARGAHQSGSSTCASHDRPARHARRELAADRLDLGELGHRLKRKPSARRRSGTRLAGQPRRSPAGAP